MRTLAATIMLFALWLTPFSVSAHCVQDRGQDSLHRVQIIYVGEMGSSDTAARFRLLLKRQLSEEGFTVADSAETADAALTGVLSLPINVLYSSEADVSLTIELKDRGGDQLWFANYANFHFKGGSRDPLNAGARKVAEKLRSDCVGRNRPSEK